MNRISIIGNLTADPVLNVREYTNKATGEVLKTNVCNFTVAADEGFGASKSTEFFRVSVWRGMADVCAKYLKKGRAVFVSGPAKLNKYVSKDNNFYATIEIRGDEVLFLNDGKGAVTPQQVEEEVPNDGMPY